MIYFYRQSVNVKKNLIIMSRWFLDFNGFFKILLQVQQLDT